MREIETAFVAHIRENSARLAAACTACGECYRACPMVLRTAALDGAASEAVMAGIRDILRDGAGTADAIAFAGACTRSGVCTPACPEKLDAAFLMRLASLRVRGTLGEPPRVALLIEDLRGDCAHLFAPAADRPTSHGSVVRSLLFQPQ